MSLQDLVRRIEQGELPIVIRDGHIWGYEMDREELERAGKEARSFPGLQPPAGSRFIGSQRRHTGKYLFWKDQAGKYWYETEGGMEFKRQMELAQKKKTAPGRRRVPG